jgi:hypothetical protein
MSSIKVSALTAKTSPSGSEELLINDAGTSKKITIANLPTTDSTKLPLAGGTLTGNLSLGDNVKAQFGAGADLQIYHDGSNSYIKDVGDGDLIITSSTAHRVRTDQFQISNSANTVDILQGLPTGAVSAYYAGSKKLATTSTGVTVTGTVAATDYTGDGSALTGIDALPTQTSQNGKYLTTNGSAASWAALDTDANTTTKGLYEHAKTISSDYTISTGNNALSAGPITVASGVSVTTPSDSTWVIVEPAGSGSTSGFSPFLLMGA